MAAETTAVPAIRCEGLIKRYGEVLAVNGLDLEIRTGECFGLLGPNGAGKTTTVEILEGLTVPTAGRVEILGRSWGKDERWLREHLGIMLQETVLPETLKVWEIVALFRSFFATGLSVDGAIAMVGLDAKREERFSSLSGGQKQRVGIACALAGDPKLLFLDEPTAALDPQSRRSVWDVVGSFKQRGGTVLITTHHMDEAERLCDRVGIVDRGKIIALGTPQELIKTIGGSQLVEFSIVDATPGRLAFAADALGMVASVRACRVQGDRLVLAVEQLHVALPAVLELLTAVGNTLTDLTTRRASLEDVFVTLTGRALRD